MRSFLSFAVLQITIYTLGMSDAMTISLIVLGSAVTLFAAAYIYASVKDRRIRRKSVNAALELR